MTSANTFLSTLLCLLSFSSLALTTSAAINAKEITEKCESSIWDKKRFIALESNQFQVEDSNIKNQLALQLLNCLASPDSFLRDKVAFTGLSQWLRKEELSAGTVQTMFTTLMNVIQSQVVDENNVYQSFSVLTLAEVARVDRIKPFLSEQQRQNVVNSGAQLLKNTSDYQGFDKKVGWHHQVAHAADLMLQLALNDKINKQQLAILLDALTVQINAKHEHFYIYGEPKRFALPTVYIFLNDLYSTEDWSNWLEKLTSPAPFANWQDMYFSQEGLSKRHNTGGFLNTFYALIAKSKNDKLISMLPALEQAMKKVN